MSLPSINEIEGRWKQRAGDAKVVWVKLTENERLTLEGHSDRLIRLTQGRCGVSRDEAELQVKGFLEKLGK